MSHNSDIFCMKTKVCIYKLTVRQYTKKTKIYFMAIIDSDKSSYYEGHI